VPLDDVLADLGRVTPSELGGDSELRLYHCDVRNLDDRDVETILSQVTHPLAAASSSRAEAHRDRRDFTRRGGEPDARDRDESERRGTNSELGDFSKRHLTSPSVRKSGS